MYRDTGFGAGLGAGLANADPMSISAVAADIAGFMVGNYLTGATKLRADRTSTPLAR